MGSSTRAGRHQSFQLRDENLDDPLDDNIIEDDMNGLSREEHADGEEEENLDGPIMRKTRGGTFMKHLWGMPKGSPKNTLVKNRFAQPVGEKRGTLAEFLGTIARNGLYCPIHVDDWRHIPDEDKRVMLDLVKEKFEVEPVMESWILQTIGKRWRNWKTELRSKYKEEALPYNRKRNAVEVRVQEDQWANFKSNSNTDKAKDLSKRNKVVRSMKKTHHRTGKTSFAQRAYKLEEENKVAPSRATLFKACYTDSLGNPKCDAVASIIDAIDERNSQLQPGQVDEVRPNDIFGQVKGPERNGRVRMLGAGVSPTDVWGVLPSRSRLAMEKQDVVDKLAEQLKAQAAQIAKLTEWITRQNSSDQPVTSPPSTTSTRRPLRVGAFVTMKSMSDVSKTVAKGFLKSLNPTDVVGGTALGKNWCEVLVQVVVENSEDLIRPYDLFLELRDVIGCSVAWPCHLVIVEDE